jgi:hypothetical protein
LLSPAGDTFLVSLYHPTEQNKLKAELGLDQNNYHLELLLCYINGDTNSLSAISLIADIFGSREFQVKNFYADWSRNNEYIVMTYRSFVPEIDDIVPRICVWCKKTNQFHYQFINTPGVYPIVFNPEETHLITFMKEYHVDSNTIKDQIMLRYENVYPGKFQKIFEEKYEKYIEWVRETLVREPGLADLEAHIILVRERIHRGTYLQNDFLEIRKNLY